MRARIATELLDRVLAHAAETPALEVCGLLLGRAGRDGWRITAAPAAANVSDRPGERFEIDPTALFGALRRQERAGGATMLGHYHSHPDGAPEPSPRDAESAEPGRLWLILAQGEARLWLAEAGGGFAAIALDATA